MREFFALHPRVLVIAQAEDLPRLQSYLPEGTTFEPQTRTRGKLYFAVSPRTGAPRYRPGRPATAPVTLAPRMIDRFAAPRPATSPLAVVRHGHAIDIGVEDAPRS